MELNSKNPRLSWWKISVAVIASGYFVINSTAPGKWHFLDSVNLLIHEAGHVIFTPFGQFMYFLGGSVAQILLPLLFVFYFWFKGHNFSAALVLFWAGQSIENVGVYAGDAAKMSLPLIGDGAIHDWNWLLTRLNLLDLANPIGTSIKAIGILIIIFASLWSLWGAVNRRE